LASVRRKHSPAATAPLPKWWQRRRVILSSLVVLMAFGMGWQPLCHELAERNLRQRRNEAAEAWLDRSAVMPWSSARTHFLRARLSRHLLNLDLAAQELERAQNLGCAAERIARERGYLQAQSGQLENLLPELRRQLLDANEDGQELCEAFANGLLINGLVEDAMTLIAAWKQDYPQDPQPCTTLGRWLESQNRIDEAQAEYAAALKRQTGFAPALYALGRLALNRSQPAEGREQFRLASHAVSANAAPQVGQARCLHQLGEIPAAQAILERVVQLPEAAVARSFALVQDPDTSLPAERLLGEILTGLGQHAEALENLDKALQREPRDPSLRYQRAQCLQGLGRQEEAAGLFREVADDRIAIAEADRLVDEIRQHPGNPQVELRFRVGELFWKHDSSRKAEYWLRNTLVHAPDHPGAHELLAQCYALRASHDPTARNAAAHFRRRADELSSAATQGTEGERASP
jgi:tetratricopeptide (TPR) repeat protein